MDPKHPTIYFHVGMGKTGTTYLQYKFFPRLRNIYYIQRTRYRDTREIIARKKQSKYLISREFDNQLYREVDWFSSMYPDARPIIVLRRHDSWIASQYRRYTKNGRGFLFHEFIDMENNKGHWDKEALNFYHKIQYLEAHFNYKPLVLFYDDFKKNPMQFFDKLARYMGATFKKSAISLSAKHISYNHAQLIAARRFARKYFSKGRYRFHKGIMRWLEYRSYWLTFHLVLYAARLFPPKGAADEELIPEQTLQTIRANYAHDWEQCLTYARENPMENLMNR